MDIGDVNLNDRTIDIGDGIAQIDSIMRQPTRIDHHTQVIHAFLQLVNQIAHMVALVKLDVSFRKSRAQVDLNIGQGLVPVDPGFPLSGTIQIGSIQDKDS